MRKENVAFCAECRTMSPYELKKIERRYEIREKELDVEVTVAICKTCGAELNVPGIMDLRAKEIDLQYRKLENIISVTEIENLMELYHIGKAPLSLALGFGEITITRYLQGQVPSGEYSEIMRNALESPTFMIGRLDANRKKMGETAYKKAMKEARALTKLLDISEKMLSTISYIFEKGHEVTPLALQKMLYFIQGVALAILNKPLFEEDCQAWAHGPVYKSVYEIFKSFKYNPIDDIRFNILKNRFQMLTADEKKIIDLVMDTFGIYSGKTLEKITHNETPWTRAREGYDLTDASNVIISKDDIASYFSSLYRQYNLKTREGIHAYIRKQLSF